jgi:hypothetical protein
MGGRIRPHRRGGERVTSVLQNISIGIFAFFVVYAIATATRRARCSRRLFSSVRAVSFTG